MFQDYYCTYLDSGKIGNPCLFWVLLGQNICNKGIIPADGNALTANISKTQK